MAINPYNKPQEEKKESDLDKVLKGLTVASNVFGIVTDYKKLAQMKADNELKVQEAQRQREAFKLQQNDDFRKQTEFDQKQANATKNILDVNKADQFDVSDQPGKGRIQAQLPDGTTVFVKAKPTVNPNALPKEPTSSQFTAATFGERAKKAELDFATLQEAGFDRSDRTTAAGNSLASIIGLESNDFRRQKQAERNFVNALLRRESGAAISPSEFSNAEQQYFPRAGDDDATKKQKAENRQIAIAGLSAEGAPAQSRVEGQIQNAKNSATNGPQPKNQQSPLAAGLTGLKKKASQPKTVIQNGHTYKLNEKTGEYE